MTMDKPYTNRELDMKFEGVHTKLDLILAQTTKTNGRVSKHDDVLSRHGKIILGVGVAIGILLITNGSRFVEFISAITK